MSIRAFLASVFGSLLFYAGVSHAATVTFGNVSVTAGLNDIITIDLLMDFTDDATLGGGTDIFFNATVLSFQSFDFSSTTLVLDPAFGRLPDADVLPGKLEGMAFGNFGGLSGPGVIGTLTFQAIAVGDSALTMAVTTEALKGGDFISDNTFGPQVVNFGSANVSVVSTVPIPAAVWLFGSGLIGLAGVAAKRRTT